MYKTDGDGCWRRRRGCLVRETEPCWCWGVSAAVHPEHRLESTVVQHNCQFRPPPAPAPKIEEDPHPHTSTRATTHLGSSRQIDTSYPQYAHPLAFRSIDTLTRHRPFRFSSFVTAKTSAPTSDHTKTHCLLIYLFISRSIHRFLCLFIYSFALCFPVLSFQDIKRVHQHPLIA